MHYHLLSGLRGYMPDSNTAYETQIEAMQGLEEFGRLVVDSCELTHSHCYVGDTEQVFISFLSGHGVEYAGITDCDMPLEECFEG